MCVAQRDHRLRQGFELYGHSGAGGRPDWTRIAQHVGGGFSRHQCLRRWSNYLDPSLQELKSDVWSAEEVCCLLSIAYLCNLLVLYRITTT